MVSVGLLLTFTAAAARVAAAPAPDHAPLALHDAAGARIVVPTGLPDGFYTVAQADDGTWNHTLQHTLEDKPHEYWLKQFGELLNGTSTDAAADASGSVIEARGKSGGFCNDPPIYGDESFWNIVEAQYAESRYRSFSDYCFTSKADYIIANNYVVFGCNYRSVSCQSLTGFNSDLSWVGNACRGKAGWYSHDINSFGRSLRGLPIC